MRELCQRLGARLRRFRFAGEKEAAGAAVAVIQERIMDNRLWLPQQQSIYGSPESIQTMR